MILKKVQILIENAKLPVSFSPASESIPADRIILKAGPDYRQRERDVEIIAREQPFNPVADQQLSQDHYYRIQFSSLLPFEAIPPALNQTASLVLFLNQLMDWPGFELNELTNQISYRYVWFIRESALDSQLLLTIIGSILLNLDLFSQTIEQVAEGQSTFNDLLESIVKFGEQLRSEP